MIIKGLVFCHRGYHKNVPENSISSFKKALYRNKPIELDIRILKDNNIVVFHDKNLKRMTGINKNLDDCTYEEIKNITLKNSFETIPLFKDVLELIQDKVMILIEIKKCKKKIEKQLLKLLKEYNNFIIQTFSIKTFCWFKLNKPDYTIGLLSIGSGKIKSLLKPDFISHSLYGAKRYKNIPLFIWMIDNEKELEKAKKIGDSFIVDYTQI